MLSHLGVLKECEKSIEPNSINLYYFLNKIVNLYLNVQQSKTIEIVSLVYQIQKIPEPE